MFTALKRLAIPGQRLPFVQYIVSLAVAQAVQAEAAARLQVGRAAERLAVWGGVTRHAVARRHMAWV